MSLAVMEVLRYLRTGQETDELRTACGIIGQSLQGLLLLRAFFGGN